MVEIGEDIRDMTAEEFIMASGDALATMLTARAASAKADDDYALKMRVLGANMSPRTFLDAADMVDGTRTRWCRALLVCRMYEREMMRRAGVLGEDQSPDIDTAISKDEPGDKP